MILSCIAFASMWVVIRYASRDLHAFQIVFFRNAIVEACHGNSTLIQDRVAKPWRGVDSWEGQ
jgi:hypothetical protein